LKQKFTQTLAMLVLTQALLACGGQTQTQDGSQLENNDEQTLFLKSYGGDYVAISKQSLLLQEVCVLRVGPQSNAPIEELSNIEDCAVIDIEGRDISAELRSGDAYGLLENTADCILGGSDDREHVEPWSLLVSADGSSEQRPLIAEVPNCEFRRQTDCEAQIIGGAPTEVLTQVCGSEVAPPYLAPGPENVTCEAQRIGGAPVEVLEDACSPEIGGPLPEAE